MIVSDQNWIEYTGFTSDPTIRYYCYQIFDNVCSVWFFYEGYGVSSSAVPCSFKVPLPAVALDEGATVLGGHVFFNFNPTTDNLISNTIIIPKSTIQPNIESQFITIEFDKVLNNENGNKMNGNFMYTFGSPY